MSSERIVIIGFMATGKTTVAYELARKLNCLAIDLDDLIERRQGRGPGEIIEQDGEAAFRTIETEALREVLRDTTARVIAVGGGGWTVAENRELIARQGAMTVWLDAPFELCWKRIEAGRALRPLAPSREIALQLYAQRRPVYESADLRVHVSEHESAEEIAMKVASAVSAAQGAVHQRDETRDRWDHLAQHQCANRRSGPNRSGATANYLVIATTA
jgi:shikimate kinase